MARVMSRAGSRRTVNQSDEMSLAQLCSKGVECPANLLDSAVRRVPPTGNIVRQLPLSNTGDTRQSGKGELSAVICQKGSYIIGERKLQPADFVRKVNTERVDHGQKIIKSFFGRSALPYCVEVEIIVIGHIGAVDAILSTFYKYSYCFHIF